MKLPKYDYQKNPNLKSYLFVSNGIKGKITKMVIYKETETSYVYNLGFGYYNENTKDIDDLIITNNGDSIKVLAIVANTLFDFVNNNPQSWIFATGSTAVRTRLYRMGITNNLAEIAERFIVFGLSELKEWTKFIVGEDYEAFLITKKEIIYVNDN